MLFQSSHSLKQSLVIYSIYYDLLLVLFLYLSSLHHYFFINTYLYILLLIDSHFFYC